MIGHPDAFVGSGASIDGPYVEGVSVTRGSPRQHIWTFAAGIDEQSGGSSTCPCVNGSTNGNRIPSFIGQNYFCETGSRGEKSGEGLGSKLRHGPEMVDSVNTNRVHVTY